MFQEQLTEANQTFHGKIDELTPYYVEAYQARWDCGVDSQEAKEVEAKLKAKIESGKYDPDVVSAASRVGFCRFTQPLVDRGEITEEDFLNTLFDR